MRAPLTLLCRRVAAAGVLALGCAAGCSGGEELPDAGAVVVGVQSELRAGVDLDRVHFTLRAGEETLRDEVHLSHGGQPVLAFPVEIASPRLAPGRRVELTLAAYGSGPLAGEPPLVTRRAATEIVAHRTLLLRAPIELACRRATTGGDTTPKCPDPATTCARGACVDPLIPPWLLEDHRPGWADETWDVCKPPGAGEPVVIVGQGMSDYLPMEDHATAQVEAGPQGGHHIWVALRMKNLLRSGSLVTLTGHLPELGHDVVPFKVMFTFEPDEGGFCKLFGLRFQLDAGGEDIATMLGKRLDVMATVSDPGGDVGVGVRIVTLSSQSL